MKRIIFIMGMLCCCSFVFGQANNKVGRVVKTERTTVAAQSSANENDPIYESVDVKPEFPGGIPELMKYLTTHLKYPTKAQKKGIQGRVLCTFIVEKDGRVNDVRVVKSVDPDLDKEAMRVVKHMPKWKPGLKDGKPVRTKFTLPVAFAL
jgi:protein TonB